MRYEDLKVYRETQRLLLRVSKLHDERESAGNSDFHSLKQELMEALTCIWRASENPEDATAIDAACAHILRSKVWLRVLTETHLITRFVYQQLNITAAGIMTLLTAWPDNPDNPT